MYTNIRTSLYKGYTLVPFRKEDLFQIMKWRNSQMEILRQNTKLTKTNQLNYYEDVIEPSFQQQFPGIMLFSYLQDNKCIGYGGLTNLDWNNRHAELSFLVNTTISKNKSLYEQAFDAFLHLIKHITFVEHNLHRLFTETYEYRSEHIKILERNGFVQEGKLKEHIRCNSKYYDSYLHGLINE